MTYQIFHEMKTGQCLERRLSINSNERNMESEQNCHCGLESEDLQHPTVPWKAHDPKGLNSALSCFSCCLRRKFMF
jgi:hypothetical protein